VLISEADLTVKTTIPMGLWYSYYRPMTYKYFEIHMYVNIVGVAGFRLQSVRGN